MGRSKQCPVRKLDTWNGEPHFLNCEIPRHPDDQHEARGVRWTAPSPPMKPKDK